MWQISFESILGLIISAIMLPSYSAVAAALNDIRIVNGVDASLSESKHQVSIRLRSREYYFGHGHICGGSVISKNVVLSAAHCFVNYDLDISLPEEDFIAVMGTLDRLNCTKTTLIFNVMKIIIHENFEFATLANDIALLILNGDIPTQHPTAEEIFLNDGPIKSDTLCQVTGWGYSEIPKLSRKLKIADQPIIDKDVCLKKFIFGFLVRNGMMCAGYLEDETNINRGDSGGPLVCCGIQVGVVSFRSWENLGPSIYTDVAYYKKWILGELVKYNCAMPKFRPVSSISTVSVTV